MVKVCAVKNCLSGCKAERKERKELNLRQTALFKVPKCPNRLREWRSALSQPLIDKNFICELHFKEEDVIKEDIINLSDGNIYISPRIKYDLALGAIPISTNTSTGESRQIHDNGEDNGFVHNGDSDTMFIEETLNSDCIENKCVLEEQISRNTSDDVDQQICNSETINEFTLYENYAADTVEEQISANGLETKPEEKLDTFSLATIQNILNDQALPFNWSRSETSEDDSIVILFYIDPHLMKVKLKIVISADFTIMITVVETGISVTYDHQLSSVTHFWSLLSIIAKSQFCSGSGFLHKKCSDQCNGILNPHEEYKRYKKENRCCNCRLLRKKLLNSKRKNNCYMNKRLMTIKRKFHSKSKRLLRLQRKNEELKDEIDGIRSQCALVKEKILEDEISNLPEAQKEAVRACFQAAKAKNSKQRRYTIEWVYECLMIRIKGPAVYEKLRTRQILPLPCKDTLNKYISKLDSAFGFPKAIFDTLRLKASRMPECNKRGTLLIDEIALSEAVKLNTKSMEFNGFVNLGEYTPNNLINERADHALVFMFQPFQGQWVQVLGYFLSKTAVTKEVLHKLIIDCIIQLEKNGLKVDVITSDGAQWNRGVWKIFGIEDHKFSCTHPYATTRRLWFISDFPHLLKCFRTKIMEGATFWTPDGTVKKSHWEALLKNENHFKANLKIAYKLSPEHLNPEGYKKMNVRLAEELFSKSVRVAMLTLKDHCYDLNDCEATVNFINRVDNLIKAMSSRTPANALRPQEECRMRKVIVDFDMYLRNWEAKAFEEKQKSRKNKKKPTDRTENLEDFNFAITTSTLTGLKITLGGTLELINFLHNECQFDYLMTARLNQDKLEQFFGIVRSACGCNEHPDPILFGQVFRLLCSYSLVTPLKGSNVTAAELLQSLMETKESLLITKDKKLRWLEKIDSIIENGYYEDTYINLDASVAEEPFENLLNESSEEELDNPDSNSHMTDLHSSDYYIQEDCNMNTMVSVAEQPFESLLDESSEEELDHPDVNSNIMDSHCDPHLHHDYDVAHTSGYVIAYIAGYIARKMQRFSRCFDCLSSLESEKSSGLNKVIDAMGDCCKYPSENLYKLIERLENIVLQVVGTKTVKMNTMSQILDKIAQEKSLPYVGCYEHRLNLMKKLLHYFITIRGHFLANSINKNYTNRKNKSKQFRKNSKLI